MSDSIFVRDGDRFVATEHARGPWDPNALHGGAVAALIASAFERTQPGAEMPIARLDFQLLRPIPFHGLSLEVSVVRAGRRVQELVCELRSEQQLIARAGALRVQEVPRDLPEPPPGRERPLDRAMPGPEEGRLVRFSLDEDEDDSSFAASGVEMRWLSEPRELGPGRVWMRLRHPLLPREEASPLARLAATADFVNGISSELPFDRYLFINADLTIHLWRAPRGEWIGLDGRTLLHPGDSGIAEGVLHDIHGPVGRAFQSLVVQAR